MCTPPPLPLQDPSFHVSLYWCLGDITSRGSVHSRGTALVQVGTGGVSQGMFTLLKCSPAWSKYLQSSPLCLKLTCSPTCAKCCINETLYNSYCILYHACMQDEWTMMLEDSQVEGSDKLTFELCVEEARCKTGNKLYSFPLSN